MSTHFPPLFRHPPTHRSKHGTSSRKDISAHPKVHQLCSGGHWGQTQSGVLHRREQAPTVSETRSELRCTTYTDASPLRRLHTASASCDPDEWTKVVRKEPAGPGALWVVLICDIWTGSAWVSQGMAGRPCSRMAQPGGPAPGLRPGLGTFCQNAVWLCRVVLAPGLRPGPGTFCQFLPPIPSPRTRIPP
jgi:hypothetical protein